MTTANPLCLRRHFATLKDPRRRHRRLHRLLDIITIAICAVIAGADDWQQIATFGQRRRDWLQRFLPLPHGIPSHDTFERVFDRLAPQAFQACFRQWVQALAEVLGVRQVAIDGKTLRGSATGGLAALHLVSAWATANHLTLGQVAVDSKSNEITAIPRLLELLDLHGALVTIDAMGCQKEIARQIVDGGGDYLLVVKDNQPTLLADIQACFAQALDNDFAGLDHDCCRTSCCRTSERGHGRHEQRCYHIIREPQGLRQGEVWAGLHVIGLCCSERTVGGETSTEVRYFIGSKAAGARAYGKALRGHWGIENGLHWHLDITFGEDASRVSKRHGAENFALLRRLALTLLKRHPAKQSIACKRLAAALDTGFLEEILRGNGNSENE
jgi:predicted transposase YbfD/YdcC